MSIWQPNQFNMYAAGSPYANASAMAGPYGSSAQASAFGASPFSGYSTGYNTAGYGPTMGTSFASANAYAGAGYGGYDAAYATAYNGYGGANYGYTSNYGGYAGANAYANTNGVYAQAQIADPYMQQYGQAYGQQYGQSYGQPYGQPYCPPQMQTVYGQPQVNYGQPYAVNGAEQWLIREQTQIIQPVPVGVPYGVPYEVPVPVYIDRPVPVEVPVERIVEKPIYIEQPAPPPPPPPPHKAKKKKKKRKKSPLAFDLNRNGIQTKAQKVNFDIDGSGRISRVNDINDGILTIDLNRNGNSGENGKELLGDYTDLSALGITQKFTDGFDALRALAQHAKANGLINSDDTLSANELSIMEKVYGLKMKLGGLNSQAVSLSQAGVTSINLSTGAKQRIVNFDGLNNDTVKQQGATFTTVDGSTNVYEDVFLNT